MGGDESRDLVLSAADYGLVLEHVEPDPDISPALRAGVVDGMFLRFRMSDEVAAALMFEVINAVGCGPERRVAQALERVAANIRGQLERRGVQFEFDPLEIIRAAASHNRTPQADLGGFTPEQLHILFSNDWRTETPGLLLRRDAPLASLGGSRILHNARVLLAALSDNGVRSTEAGNLNRAFVSEMITAMQWRDGVVEDLFRWNKVVNERDVRPLHDLRVILELAGMAGRKRARFALTRAGREALAEDRAGALFAELIHTTFRRFNLGYHDRLPETRAFQDTIAFPLAVLSREPPQWRPAADLLPRLLLPSVAATIPAMPYIDTHSALVRLRLIEPLEELGLLECRRVRHRSSYHLDELLAVRRTPLFDHVIGFDWGW
jgi:hypothetical protein